jgi:transcription antitermination factor NusG
MKPSTDDRQTVATPAHPEARIFVMRYNMALEKALERMSAYLGIDTTILKFTRRAPHRNGIISRHWFPGYAFSRINPTQDGWQGIYRAPGFLGFLGVESGYPVPIDETVWTDLVARCPERLPGNDEHTVIPVGSMVEVIDGPLRGRVGVVSSSRGSTAWVELIVFNQPTRVEIQTRSVLIMG